ncbi:hypothetical protein QBA38_27050 [Streptomyces stelliscabiei]|nr:hypothetical protein [Streptomyces sp. 1222.2]
MAGVRRVSAALAAVGTHADAGITVGITAGVASTVVAVVVVPAGSDPRRA